MTYNLVGQKFGQLTVIEKLSLRDSSGRTQWKCLCLCGDYKVAVTYRLTEIIKGLRSCGKCEWHIRHREAYISWMSMKQRCSNKNNKDYLEYGGRGIIYDPRWENFAEFFIDMGDPPYDLNTGERLSLDRENNDGNYCKDNCRWATRSEQQLNKRTSPITNKVAEQEQKL